MKKHLSLVFLLLMLMFVGISPSLAHENPPDRIPEDDEIVTHGSEIPEPPPGVEIPEGFPIEEFVGEEPDEDLVLHGGGVHCSPWVLNCCRY
ncbi:MAG: hypothetical protein OXP68_04560 [Anaerolineaceae bacterium]|nr:hypothetical protein [Anaerolineaceae bacterium]MDE0327795.1 hypothetical protein [Anaerolineaceae bacterium]